MKKAIIAIALIALIALFAFGVKSFISRSSNHGETNHTGETAPDGDTVTKVITAQLAVTSRLVVQQISGELEIEVKTDRWLLPDAKRIVRVPYTANYFVELSQVSHEQMSWDSERQSMTVVVPDVEVELPNVDETQLTNVVEDGWFVSRKEADAMRRKVSINADFRAKKEAGSRERIESARLSARRELTSLLESPLRAAGIRGVNVVVKFPFEGDPRSSDRWDTTATYEEARDARDRIARRVAD